MNTNDLIKVVAATWVDMLSALLTPLIALIAVFIAYQQYRTNHLRLRHELYERRLSVYRSVQSFLSEVLREGDVPWSRTGQFYADASEAAFLFDQKVQKFIDEVYEKAIDLHGLREKLYPSDGSTGLPVGHERSKVAHENGELLKWLIRQLPRAKELFREHMQIK